MDGRRSIPTGAASGPGLGPIQPPIYIQCIPGTASLEAQCTGRESIPTRLCLVPRSNRGAIPPLPHTSSFKHKDYFTLPDGTIAQLHAPATLPPGKQPHIHWIGGPQSRSETSLDRAGNGTPVPRLLDLERGRETQEGMMGWTCSRYKFDR
jgi:hypothetical protein